MDEAIEAIGNGAVAEREQAVMAREDAAMGTADALEMAETAAPR